MVQKRPTLDQCAAEETNTGPLNAHSACGHKTTGGNIIIVRGTPRTGLQYIIIILRIQKLDGQSLL